MLPIIMLLMSSIFAFDELMNQKIAFFSTPLLTKIMEIVSVVFDPLVLGILSLFIIAFFIYKRKWHSCLFWLLSIGSVAISVYVLKILFHRLRPELGFTGFSFPSGHAATGILFFCLIIYYCRIYCREKILSSKISIFFTSISIFLILLIGFNRIYLHAHWFSDVIAGYALGLFIFFFYYHYYHYLVTE